MMHTHTKKTSFFTVVSVRFARFKLKARQTYLPVIAMVFITVSGDPFD